MDSTTARRTRLKEWIDTQFEGRVSALCRYHQLSPSMASYLSQILSGHRSLGEKAARRLESLCGKQPGWLDAHMPTAPSADIPPITYDRNRVARLPLYAREQIEAFIDLTLSRYEAKSTKVLDIDDVESPADDTRKKVQAASRRAVSREGQHLRGKQAESQNIVNLAERSGANIRARQEKIRRVAQWIASAPESEAPVAGMSVYFDPSGDIHTVIRNIEPEHVDPILSTLHDIAGKLKAFRDNMT